MRLLRPILSWFWKYYGIKLLPLGFSFFQLIYVATKLQIADRLIKKPQTCQQLATEMKVDESSLLLILNLLEKLGFIFSDKNGIYHITSVGDRLSLETENSLAGTILSSGSFVYQNWGNLSYSIQTGKAASEKSFNMDIYEYLSENPESSHNFNLWMQETTRELLFPALSHYNFFPFNTIVDVGGNTGFLTKHILQKYPKLKGVIFDLKETFTEENNELNRYKFVEGNFFESIPQGGDLYIISRVLLNWSDEDAIKILTNCRKAMQKSAKLLIIDFTVSNSSPLELMASLNSLVMNGQQIRTVEGYYNLLKKSGFSNPKLINKKGILKLIETSIT
jgi:hypothetical protein